MENNNLQDTLSGEPPIHSGHLSLIAICAVFLVSMTFMKNGFKLKFAENRPEQKVVTLEEVKRQIAMENGGSSEEFAEAQQKNNEQLAIISPGAGEGQVLGATTDETEKITSDVEMVLTKEYLSKISIKQIAATSENLKTYANQVLYVESSLGLPDALATLNGEDATAIADAGKKIQEIMENVSALQVPDSAAYFHRLKLMYYGSLIQLSNSLGSAGSQDLGETTALLFSVLDKINIEQENLQKQYGVVF